MTDLSYILYGGEIIKSKIIAFDRFFAVKDILREKRVSTLSASLAYYMMLSLFPSLIVIKALIDSIGRVDWSFVLRALPDEVDGLITEYLAHTEGLDGSGIIAGGIFLSVFTLVKFVRCLKNHLDTINGVRYKRHVALSWLLALITALYFLMLLYLSLICIVFGESIIKLLASHVGAEELFISVWQSVRVFAVVLLLVFFLVLVFCYLPDRKLKPFEALPGIAFTVVLWILASLLFSTYINNFTSYSVVYGSLGAVAVMMLWFYVLSNIILTGACINLALHA